jgi:hydroxyacyl-ACP dehydratase HTD2-like protein with hotdog domain
LTDRSRIGHTTAPTTHSVDAWRVRLFCRAIGETDPVFHDPAAAALAGHPACPVPPTFLKALESEHQSGAALMALHDAPMTGVLHAEQSFEFDGAVHVGDVVAITRTVTDMIDKRGGAMTFISVDSHFSVAGHPVGRATQTIMVRNPAPAAVPSPP